MANNKLHRAGKPVTRHKGHSSIYIQLYTTSVVNEDIDAYPSHDMTLTMLNQNVYNNKYYLY